MVPLRRRASWSLASGSGAFLMRTDLTTMERIYLRDIETTSASYLLSDLASGITGEITYVDGGLNTTALGNADPLPQ